MNCKTIIPVLALIAACGGELKTPLAKQHNNYNLPEEVLERTLTRSSGNGGISAYELHANGSHWYAVFAIPPVILAFSAGSQTSTPAYYLVDNVKTTGLDFPENDGSHSLLYSLLLGEQRASLDGNKADPRTLDYWLAIMERK